MSFETPDKGARKKPEHIENQRLQDAVRTGSLLNPEELQHLGNCDECLELVRVFVRQYVLKAANH